MNNRADGCFDSIEDRRSFHVTRSMATTANFVQTQTYRTNRQDPLRLYDVVGEFELSIRFETS